MEFKHLLCFKRVAELEHITKAANDLYMSQAHLSRIIAELESELGVKLFDRDGRGIKLSPCGLSLYQNVLKIIIQMDDTKKQVQTVYQRQLSQLTVVTNAGAYMPGLLLRLTKVDPTLKLRQYSAPRKDIIQMLREGSVDFAICCPPIKDELEFKSTILRIEPAVVIYPKGHWLEGIKNVSLSQLQGELFIGVAQGYGARDAVESSYYSTGISPNFIIETGDTSAVQRYVYEGLGIALVAKALIRQDEYFKDHYADIDEPASGTLAITWKKDKAFGENDNLFYQTALDFYRELDMFSNE